MTNYATMTDSELLVFIEHFGAFRPPATLVQEVFERFTKLHDLEMTERSTEAAWQEGYDEREREAEASGELNSDALELLRDICEDIDHDDPDCPRDDTCKCPTIARVNQILKEAYG